MLLDSESVFQSLKSETAFLKRAWVTGGFSVCVTMETSEGFFVCLFVFYHLYSLKLFLFPFSSGETKVAVK